MRRDFKHPKLLRSLLNSGLPLAVATSMLATFNFSARPAHAAVQKRTPEEEAAALAKILKPIPDDTWRQVAGDRLAERYEITKGDTLYDISQRLFGDAKYWPKIWALNNSGITNPHLIRPGRSIAFMPGTGTSLPTVGMASDAPSGLGDFRGTPSAADDGQPSDPMDERIPPRSQEWRNLPKQSWESFRVELPPEVDPLGFDRTNKVIFKTSADFDLPAFAASDPVDTLGQIVGADSSTRHLMLGEQVFIESPGTVQVGETYALTGEPTVLSESEYGRKGLSYRLLGRVRVTSVRDNLFTGLVIAASETIPRGAYLIAVPPRATLPSPIPGPSRLEATVLLDRYFSTRESSQNKIVFIDRGSEDGVQPGMVFRTYRNQDPATQEVLGEADLIAAGDVMVVQTSQRFSTGMILTGASTITDRTPALLLTDVSDLKTRRGRGAQELNGRPSGSRPEADELEGLEPGADVGKREEKELKQLERWKPGADSDSPDGLPPPPAEDEGDLPPPPSGEGEGDLPPADASDLPPPDESAGPALPPPADDGALPPPPPDESPEGLGEGSGDGSEPPPADLPPADLPPPPAETDPIVETPPTADVPADDSSSGPSLPPVEDAPAPAPTETPFPSEEPGEDFPAPPPS